MIGGERDLHYKKDDLPEGCDVPAWVLIPFFLGCASVLAALMLFGLWLGGRL